MQTIQTTGVSDTTTTTVSAALTHTEPTITTEVWKPIRGWETLYSVSNLGRVRNDRTGRIMSIFTSTYGYVTVGLTHTSSCRGRRVCLVHRLVAEAFCENPRGCTEVHHHNHDKTDNRVENLSWVTRSENVRAAHAAGRRDHIGRERKLDQCAAEDIRYLLDQGVPGRQIAIEFGVSPTLVSQIKLNRLWVGATCDE